MDNFVTVLNFCTTLVDTCISNAGGVRNISEFFRVSLLNFKISTPAPLVLLIVNKGK